MHNTQSSQPQGKEGKHFFFKRKKEKERLKVSSLYYK